MLYNRVRLLDHQLRLQQKFDATETKELQFYRRLIQISEQPMPYLQQKLILAPQ